MRGVRMKKRQREREREKLREIDGVRQRGWDRENETE